MPYYDRIAKQWHAATGFKGGALKQYVLNDLLIDAIGSVENRSILEVGAGNGYFMPLLLRRYSGQLPKKVVVTDVSERQLDMAQKHRPVPAAEYRLLDVRNTFQFDPDTFDLIIATMVLNEVSNRGVASAIAESRRVLRIGGQLVMTVTHPRFIVNLDKRGELRRERHGVLTMPGSDGLRLPVSKASSDLYERYLRDSGFKFSTQEILPTREMLNAKRGLRNSGKTSLALVFDCVSETTGSI